MAEKFVGKAAELKDGVRRIISDGEVGRGMRRRVERTGRRHTGVEPSRATGVLHRRASRRGEDANFFSSGLLTAHDASIGMMRDEPHGVARFE